MLNQLCGLSFAELAGDGVSIQLFAFAGTDGTGLNPLQGSKHSCIPTSRVSSITALLLLQVDDPSLLLALIALGLLSVITPAPLNPNYSPLDNTWVCCACCCRWPILPCCCH
jgi:hypothetical protein